jgi:hypothetical protein
MAETPANNPEPLAENGIFVFDVAETLHLIVLERDFKSLRVNRKICNSRCNRKPNRSHPGEVEK